MTTLPRVARRTTAPIATTTTQPAATPASHATRLVAPAIPPKAFVAGASTTRADKPSPVLALRAGAATDELGALTWSALEADPKFARYPALFQSGLKPYFDNLTANLHVAASDKVSFKDFLVIQRNYVQWILDNKVIENVIAHSDLPPGAAEVLQLTLQLYQGVIGELDQIIADPDAFLKSAGATERSVLATKLSKESLAAYDAGTLTVGDLCVKQPTALFVLDSDGRS